MSEEIIKNAIRDYVDALEKNDVDRALSFFADDAVWHAPEGEYTGKEEIRRYVTWMRARGEDVKFNDTGIGIVVKDDKAVYEHIWEATYEGAPIKAPSVCVYEFSDGKCVYHKSIYDRISLAKQGSTGFIETRIVNAVIDQLERGLR
jgi:ketosteroid isomerase-like protein